MKNIKYILLIFMGLVLFNSCDVEEKDTELIPDAKNLAVFEDSKISVTKIADGTVYPVAVKVKLTGPTTYNVSSDIQVNIEYDADNSTAVEGTHFSIPAAKLVLVANNNHLGLFNFSMLTAGIATPLAESPVVAFKVTSATGDGTVINSGKQIKVTLNYACPSELQGNYTVVVLRDGGPIAPYTNVSIAKTGVGTYRTSEVGHWPAAALGYTPGYTFTDVCGVLNIPQQNLVDAYGNQVQSTEPGTVDEATGVLHMVYSISSSGWSSVYDVTYTPVK